MAKIERLSTNEAAEKKGCTAHAIRYAVNQGHIDCERYGRTYIILANKKFEAWQPNPKIQKAVKERGKRK